MRIKGDGWWLQCGKVSRVGMLNFMAGGEELCWWKDLLIGYVGHDGAGECAKGFYREWSDRALMHLVQELNEICENWALAPANNTETQTVVFLPKDLC